MFLVLFHGLCHIFICSRCFAIDVVNDLEVEVILVEDSIVVEQVEMGKGIGGKTMFMFMDMNLYSYC